MGKDAKGKGENSFLQSNNNIKPSYNNVQICDETSSKFPNFL